MKIILQKHQKVKEDQYFHINITNINNKKYCLPKNVLEFCGVFVNYLAEFLAYILRSFLKIYSICFANLIQNIFI